MTTDETDTERNSGPARTPPAARRPALTAMMEARSVAVVGASAREGTLGQRMVAELGRSPAHPLTYLVNPKYTEIGGTRCFPSLTEVPRPVDLVLLGVPDPALAEQVSVAAGRGDRAAVIFGGAHDPAGTLRQQIAASARDAGMAVCGAGCMGFVNLRYGLRAVGYVEAGTLPAGPVALVTHSGSVFSALLRTRRAFGFTVAVSSGQEIVTTAAQYARYALTLPQTRVLALVMEAMRAPGLLRQVLAEAAAAGIPVVLLTAGRSDAGRRLVAAHSGALAGEDGAWEALADAYGVHRVRDLAELADTLELFVAGRRVPPGTSGIATVHDSGLERAHLADLASDLGIPFAPIGAATRARLAAVLDPGLEPANPLDMWGGSERAQWQLTESLTALASDPAVGAVALAVDLVTEFDGDRSYPHALADTARATGKPVAALASIPAAVDPVVAGELRGAGIPVLETSRSGLLALRHLLAHASRPAPPAPQVLDEARRARWSRWLRTAAEHTGAGLFELLAEYGLSVTRVISADSADAAVFAATTIGYPVVLKTAEPGIAHKTDAGGVALGIASPAGLRAAYADLAARLGPRVLVCETAPPGVELAAGIFHDRALGSLVVVAAGGVLAEYFADRAVALPPVDADGARRMISRLRMAPLLAGARGQQAADGEAIAHAITSVATIACELGDELAALDVNPLICGPGGAVAVDALAFLRSR